MKKIESQLRSLVRSSSDKLQSYTNFFFWQNLRRQDQYRCFAIAPKETRPTDINSNSGPATKIDIQLQNCLDFKHHHFYEFNFIFRKL